MTAIHTLSVVIGAALKGNFGATMAQGASQLNRLGQANYNAIPYLPNVLGWKLKTKLNP
jgi:hypothetical protein